MDVIMKKENTFLQVLFDIFKFVFENIQKRKEIVSDRKDCPIFQWDPRRCI